MKYLFVLLLTAGLFAQTERSSNWGKAFTWGNTFTDAGSTKVSGAKTNIEGTDTLYTDALPIQENTSGIYKIDGYWEYTDAASDSIELDVRIGTLMKRRTYSTAKIVKWDSWESVWNLKSTNTLYSIYIARTDSSWWMPANFRQYRTYRLDTETVDTCTVYVTDFLR